MKKRYLIPIIPGLLILSGCGNNPSSADLTNNGNTDISSGRAESYELIIAETDESLFIDSRDDSALPIMTESHIETTTDYTYPTAQTEATVIIEEANSTESTLTAINEDNNTKPRETKESKPVTTKKASETLETSKTKNPEEIVYEFTEDNAEESLPLIIEDYEPPVTFPDTAVTSVETVTTVSTSQTYYIPIITSEMTDHGGSETTTANNAYTNTEVIELPIIWD